MLKEKYQNFSAENFQFLKLKKSPFIAWASFIMYPGFHSSDKNALLCACQICSIPIRKYFSTVSKWLSFLDLANRYVQWLLPYKEVKSCVTTVKDKNYPC